MTAQTKRNTDGQAAALSTRGAEQSPDNVTPLHPVHPKLIVDGPADLNHY
jgi:hypothetical protein